RTPPSPLYISQPNTHSDLPFRRLLYLLIKIYGYEIWDQEELPKCESCGGRILPWELYSHIGLWEEGVKKAQDWISQADLLLVIGTNGYYGSAYWDYRRRDAVIVQINPGHTGFDSVADLNIREPCDDVFQKLKERRGRNG
ncbi:MAG: hypothetical protein LIO94_01570, partial [Clostridiales bacterium]|nr:hypothetical protein [Clostridiales bacterium]